MDRQLHGQPGHLLLSEQAASRFNTRADPGPVTYADVLMRHMVISIPSAPVTDTPA